MPEKRRQSPRVRSPLSKALAIFWEFARAPLTLSDCQEHYDSAIDQLLQLVHQSDPLWSLSMLLQYRPQAFKKSSDSSADGLRVLEHLQDFQRLFKSAVQSIYQMRHFREAIARTYTVPKDERVIKDGTGVDFVAGNPADFRSLLATKLVAEVNRKMREFAMHYEVCLLPQFSVAGERILVPQANDLQGIAVLLILESWNSERELVRECAYSKCANLLIPQRKDHRTCCTTCRVKHAEEVRQELEELGD